VHGSTTVDLEVRRTHLNHLKVPRRVDFVKSQVLKSSGLSIVRGHVAADQHFADSQLGKGKGQSHENTRNPSSRLDRNHRSKGDRRP
jgi:hypothetical protein